MIIGNPIIVGGSGGGATLIEKSITSNGVYDASSDQADGYSKVTVSVAQPTIIARKNITENGTFNASTEGAAGYGIVVVDVAPDVIRCPRVEETTVIDLDDFFEIYDLSASAAEAV